jgi:ribosomal protein S4
MCINTVRLNSYISKKFKKTDKESRQLITNGCVKVGGVIRKEPGFRLNIAELVEVEQVWSLDKTDFMI